MSILVGASKGLPAPFFVALNIVGEVISLALYQEVDLQAEQAPEVIPDFTFGLEYCKNPDATKVLNLHDMVTVDKNNLPPSMNLKRLDCLNNIYAPIDDNGFFKQPYNKHAETYLYKDNGIQHIMRARHNIIAQFGLPFPDSPLADCSIRITYHQALGYWSNVPVEVVPNTHQGYIDFGKERIPGLNPSLTQIEVNPDAEGAFDIQLVDGAGVAINRKVRLFIKSPMGYLPKTEIYTNDSGRATIRFKAWMLNPGDKFTINCGFKWFSSLANVEVRVV